MFAADCKRDDDDGPGGPGGDEAKGGPDGPEGDEAKDGDGPEGPDAEGAKDAKMEMGPPCCMGIRTIKWPSGDFDDGLWKGMWGNGTGMPTE